MIPQRYILWFYYLGIIGIVAGMTLSKPAVSVGIFFCGMGWIFEGNFWPRLKQVFSDRFFQLSLLLVLLHFAGLLWSTNLGYGLKDSKTKLPLLLIPLFLIPSRVFDLKKNIQLIQLVFLSALVLCTLLSFAIYFHWIKPLQFNPQDMRTMIFSISGVRLALFMCLGLCMLAYILWHHKSYLYKLTCLGLMAWFLFFLNFIESGTAMLFLLVLSVFSVFYLVNKHFEGWKRILVLSPFFALMGYAGYQVYQTAAGMLVAKPDPVTATHSKGGEPYLLVDYLAFMENGYLIGDHTAIHELEIAWNERSELIFYGKDKIGQPLPATVIRYLNSVGRAKDREALYQLTEQDIRNIENGIANKVYTTTSGWKKRLMQLIFELEAYTLSTSHPFGNSLTQRFEYWKIAWNLFVENPWTGVGTGDVRDAFETQYDNYPFEVKPEYRLRAHNQYLAIAVSFGIVGLILFVLYVTSLLWSKNEPDKTYLSMCFLIIMLLSFVSEDTLETQSGVTFIAFFHTLFHYRSNNRNLKAH